jgi:hypothetical protein
VHARELGWVELEIQDSDAVRDIGLVWPKIVGEPLQVRLFREHILREEPADLLDAFGL